MENNANYHIWQLRGEQILDVALCNFTNEKTFVLTCLKEKYSVILQTENAVDKRVVSFILSVFTGCSVPGR